MSDELVEKYLCENCGEWNDVPAGSVEKYPGHEGPIELWFCDECTRYER